MSKIAISAWNHMIDLPRRAEPASRSQARRHRQPSLVRRILARLLRAQERAAMRQELRNMPDWLLQDLGITRHAALREARRALWRK